MSLNDWFYEYIRLVKGSLDLLDPADVQAILTELTYTLKSNGRIFVIGNGGSAANASHFVEDLGKGASDVIARNPVHIAAKELMGSTEPTLRFKVIDLTSSVPYITAIGNDISFEDIYAKQLDNLAEPGDMLLGISVSGTSPNLIKAFELAAGRDMRTVALVGAQARNTPNSIYALANLSVAIPDEHYGRVEDIQMMLLHMIVYYFMERLQ